MNSPISQPGTPARAFFVRNAALVSGLFLLITAQLVFAGSATWVGSPPYGNSWSNPDYWRPHRVPDGPDDIATFDVSNQTSVFIDYGGYKIDSIVFNPGANRYTITNAVLDFFLSGSGIINNSGITQEFIASSASYQDSDPQAISFTNYSSAGQLVHFTTRGGREDDLFNGVVSFQDNSTAGTAVIDNEPTKNDDYAGASFYNYSSAENARITNEASDVSDYDGGNTAFADRSNAGNATIVNSGATTSSGEGGMVYFEDFSNAASSTITCHHSAQGTLSPAAIWFEGDSDGGSARIRLFGDGTLYTYFRTPGTVTIGSLEGDGKVVISAYDFGPVLLAVGSNNANTTFSGLLQELHSDPDSLGSLSKIGTGALTLSGANTYGGGTVVNSGILRLNNRVGSATGTGAVQVRGGTLAGNGTIAGAGIIGTGGSNRAVLAPGTATIGVLTIQNTFTFGPNGTYDWDVSSDTVAADQVTAAGVTIDVAALFSPISGGSVNLPTGTLFTVINNTATGPISGTFSNLADGAIITVGNNTFQANYEGGDGNDLTLTIVP